MSSPFLAEIRCVGFTFTPKGWAACDGQILPLSQNTALFSLLGTTYGGDGKSTFALPNLQGRVPIGAGQGPGLSDRFLGEESGTDAVTLIQSEMPTHTHTVHCTPAPSGQVNTATGNVPGNAFNGGTAQNIYAASVNTNLNPLAISIAGGSQPHNNDMPTLVLNFIIALQGVFPARS